MAGWNKDGKGAISTKSSALKEYPYGFSSRFEGNPGTNPEELVALTRLTYAAAPQFVARGAGAIIDIAPAAGISPDTLNGVYGGTKAYVIALAAR